MACFVCYLICYLQSDEIGVTGTRGGVSGSPLTTGGGAIDVHKVVERTGRWSWPLRGELLREERALRCLPNGM